MATTKRPSKWPHGELTIPCPRCNGSGLSKTAAAAHNVNRGPSNSLTRQSAQCGFCYGRGIVVADPSRDRFKCKHGEIVEQCPVCRYKSPNDRYER